MMKKEKKGQIIGGVIVLIVGLIVILTFVITLIGTDTAILIGVIIAIIFGIGFLTDMTNRGLPQIILIGSTGVMGGVGLIVCIVADIFYPTRLVEMFTEMVMPLSAGISIVLSILLFPFATHFFQRERLYRSLFCFLLACFSSLMLIIWGTLIFTNGALDDSELRPIIVEIIEKDSFSGSKQTDYFILFQDWREGGGEERLEVKRRFWESVNKGEMVKLMVKDGFHGYEWIVNYAEVRFEIR